MDRSMQNSQERVQKLRWPKWADAVVEESGGQVIRRRYEEGEAYPWCRLCEKWCSEEHTLSKLHLRRRWWLEESRVISNESCSLHSEACNAQGASNGVIHSNISQEVASARTATNRWGSHSAQQERVLQCSVDQVVHVPQVRTQEAVIHAPEIVSQRWEQQCTVEPAQEPVAWQDWAQWRRNGWQWR